MNSEVYNKPGSEFKVKTPNKILDIIEDKPVVNPM